MEMVEQPQPLYRLSLTLLSSKDFSSAALSRAAVTELRKEPSKVSVGCCCPAGAQYLGGLSETCQKFTIDRQEASLVKESTLGTI